MDNVLVSDIEPVHREPKVGMVSLTKAQVLTEPVTGAVWIVGEDKQVLEKFQCHSDVLIKNSPLSERKRGGP
jgi:hypothetical protein